MVNVLFSEGGQGMISFLSFLCTQFEPITYNFLGLCKGQNVSLRCVITTRVKRSYKKLKLELLTVCWGQLSDNWVTGWIRAVNQMMWHCGQEHHNLNTCCCRNLVSHKQGAHIEVIHSVQIIMSSEIGSMTLTDQWKVCGITRCRICLHICQGGCAIAQGFRC